MAIRLINKTRFLNTLALVCIVTAGCGKSGPVEKGPIEPGPYQVLEGDDLSGIALRAYGDMELWYFLLNHNVQVTTRPEFELEVGETLTVPPVAELDRSLPKSVFPKELPADYVVMPGDSLHFIAQNVYGDREQWPIIYEANRNVLSEHVKEDTRQLIAGQVLHLPAPDTSQARASGGE